MQTSLALFLMCCIAVPASAQDKPAAELPTVTAFECPKYPKKAESMRLQGMVILEVTTDGHSVSNVKLSSGHPELAPEAIKNVHTWKFADHPATTFNVRYFYEFSGHFKRDPVTKCDAKLELPTKVTVSTTMPPF